MFQHQFKLRCGYFVVCLALMTLGIRCAASSEILTDVRRIVVLGDSITYSGQYVTYLEAYFRARLPEQDFEILNLGLPSETVSGLSEPGHAGGRFPRPDLHERLDRILLKTKPDLVIACYGMNCGIYHPFSNERFQAYQDGIRRLHGKAINAGAKIMYLTPPVFDPLPIQQRTLPAGQDEYRQPYAGYNEVLDLYSTWLLAQRGRGWHVIDCHGPVNAYLSARRVGDATFRLAGDGVHVNEEGHWLITREILRYLGATSDVVGATSAGHMLTTLNMPTDLLELIGKKQRLLSNAWLNDVGHLRPGMAKGLPVDEAAEQAFEFDRQLDVLIRNSDR